MRHHSKRQAKQTNYRRMWTFLIVACVSVITFLHQARLSFQPISDYIPLPVLDNKKSRNEYSIQLLATYDGLEGREEFSGLAQCFREDSVVRGRGEASQKCSIQCQYESSDLVLHLSDDLADFPERDALVLGMVPETLGKVSEGLLHYQFPWKQLVMFYSMDAPLRVHKSAGLLRYIPFHVDLTYYDSSYIYLAYAIKDDMPRKHKINIPAKTELVVWMGPRSCPTDVEFWPRAEYVKKLSEFVEVHELIDICEDITPCSTKLSRECRFALANYKFFLAFENSECSQLITDKFWSLALSNDVVPIVYGPKKADYTAVAPPGSFIHISQFRNDIDLLAREIKWLDQNQKAYYQYFKWKMTHRIEQLFPDLELSYFCNLVPFLEDAAQMDIQRVYQTRWYGSCRHTLSKGFETFKVEKLETWIPWW